MIINTSKSAVLHFGKQSPCESYHVGADTVTLVNSFRELGVLVDNELTFSCHVNRITLSSFRLINLLFLCFKSTNASFFCSMYATYVLPILDYCSPLYCPRTVCQADRIERVQRYFTRKLFRRVFSKVSLVSYSERLKLFNLPTLSVRRVRSDLQLIYKLSHGLINVPSIDIQFSKLNQNRVILSRNRTCIASSFFTNRASKHWNHFLSKRSSADIPKFIRTLSSID